MKPATPAPKRILSTRNKVGMGLYLLPPALLLIAMILYFIANILLRDQPATTNEMASFFGDPSSTTPRGILNNTMFYLTIFTLLIALPSVITGFILMRSKK